MIARRDLLIMGGCFAAAAGAFSLRPTRRISLLGQKDLDQILPRSVGTWSARDVGDLVAPPAPESLEARLYGQIVERVYRDSSTGAEIMMLVAYGDTQTNDLQLHRPEVCYPAFGFQISGNVPIRLSIPGGVEIPARQLVADAPGRRETIIYWTRLGEFMPDGGAEQRLVRLRTAMDGYVADGVLARFSAVGSDPARIEQKLEEFIPAFVKAIPGASRDILIGTQRAGVMTASGI
jgi:EpsI family protein